MNMRVKKRFTAFISLGMTSALIFMSLFPSVTHSISIPTATTIYTGTEDIYDPIIDGDNVVYLTNNWDVAVFNITTRETTQVTTNHDTYFADISGDYVVYCTGIGDDEIYVYDLSTSTYHQITDDAVTQFFPTISGTRIYWTDYRNVNGEIYEYDFTDGFASATTTRITNTSGESEYPWAAGNYVTWVDDTDDENYDIVLFNVLSRQITKITDSDTYQQNWSSTDGETVVWQDNRSGHWDVYAYDIATGTTTQITNSITTNETYPRVSGDLITWENGNWGGQEVYIYDTNLAYAVQVKYSSVDTFFMPDISDDYLVYYSDAPSWEVAAVSPLELGYALSEVDYYWDGVDIPDGSAFADDSYYEVTLPWNFEFFGVDYASVEFDSNGNLWFGDIDPGDNYGVPLNEVDAPMIRVWNRDLDSTDQTHFPLSYSYQNKGDRVVFQWFTETFDDGGEGIPNLFEAVLYQDGRIKVDYQYFNTDCSSENPLDDEGLTRGDLAALFVFSGYDNNGNILPDICQVGMVEKSYLYYVVAEEDPEEEPEDTPIINNDDNNLTLLKNYSRGPFIAGIDGDSGDTDNIDYIFETQNDNTVVVEKTSILGAIYDFAKMWPSSVAYAFPYLLFLLLALAAYLAYRQAKDELESRGELLEISKLDKALYDEKANFLMLTSHYLRTPLTIVNGGEELLFASKKVSESEKNILQKRINSLGVVVNSALKNIENNSYLSSIRDVDIKNAEKHKFNSLFIWIPLILIGGLAAFADFVFVNVDKIEPNFINFVIQALVYVITAQFLILGIKKYANNRKENLSFLRVIDHQRAIDSARNNFIDNFGRELEDATYAVHVSLRNISGPGADSIVEGERRFEELAARLIFVSKIRSHGYRLEKDKITVSDLISGVISGYRDRIEEKELKINIDIPEDILLFSDKKKVKVIVASVLDNAIKFNKKSGSIIIRAKAAGNSISIEIEDTGEGIAEDDMLHLFKPFSRTDSVLDFEHEGLGLGLYLSNMVANFLGGEVFVESKPNKGTSVTVQIENRS